jgi:hypothetical protein
MAQTQPAGPRARRVCFSRCTDLTGPVVEHGSASITRVAVHLREPGWLGGNCRRRTQTRTVLVDRARVVADVLEPD